MLASIAASLALTNASLAPAFAQEPVSASSERKLDTVTVTAQRRAESLQDIGGAVTAVTGDQLELMGVEDSNQILNMVPNLEIQSNNSATNANIFLSGMGTSGPGFNNLGAVGIYSDDVSLNSAVVNILQTYDLERVEVLRGPQNTLYGRNTTGGAVNFISKRPEIGGGFNGSASIGAGTYQDFIGEFAVNIPVSEKSAARISLKARERGGISDNPTLGTKDSEISQIAGRIQFLYEPDDRTSLLLKAHAEDVDNTNVRWKNIGLLDPAGTAPTQTSTVVSYSCTANIRLGADCVDRNGFRDTEANDENFSNFPDPVNAVEAWGASATLERDFDGFAITSITGWETNEYRNAEDSDGSPSDVFNFFQTSSADQFSQEVRLASNDDRDLSWIGGLYYFWEDTAGSTGPAYFSNNMVNQTYLELETDVVSAYGEVEYDFTDKLTGIVGGRYSSEEKNGRNRTEARLISQIGPFLPSLRDGQNPIDYFDVIAAVDAFVANGGNPMGMSVDAPLDLSYEEWGGKVGIEYKATEDALLYANISRGFKGGNFSAAPLQAIAGRAADPVNPEIVVSYEGGARTTWLDGSLIANITLFQSDYTDQQVLRVTNNPGFGLAAILENIGGSTIRGAELDAQLVPAIGWYLSANIGLLDTEIDEYVDDAGNDFAGNKLINSPELTAFIAARREFDLQNGNVLGFGADVRYVSEKEFDLSNDIFLGAEAYTTLNLQAYYEFGVSNQYRLLISGRNVTDELYFVNKSNFSSDGFLQALLGEKATWSVGFSSDF